MGQANTLLHIRGLAVTSPCRTASCQRNPENPQQAVHMTISELGRRSGERCYSSEVLQAPGVQGFPGVQDSLAQDVVTKPQPVYGEIEPADSLGTVKDKIFQSNIQALQDTALTLSESALEEAVHAILSARRFTLRIGASGLVAQDAEKFARIGLPARSFVDAHMQITRAVLLNPGDVAVGISYSGDTYEISHAIELAKEAGAVTICITNFSKSRLAQLCDIVLLTASREHVFRSGPSRPHRAAQCYRCFVY